MATWLVFCYVAVLVLWSRYALRTSVYFADGPRLVAAIQDGSYVIQSPGYWLFAHLGGFFSDPAAGLAFWNELFSALGGVVFFLFCRQRGIRRSVSLLAALTYCFTYFAWFAGETHSSYASQLLFPPLALYCADRAHRQRSGFWLVAWALAAAVGMGLRPSDGVFLLPLTLYLLFRFEPDAGRRLLFLTMLVITIAAWYIPTHRAIAAAHLPASGSLILTAMRTVSPLLIGLHARSVANIARAVVPTLVAFGALTPAFLTPHAREDNRLVLLWLLPGMAFCTLCYMSDPTYLLFCSGAWVFYAATCRRQSLALACLGICLAFNVTLFFGSSPVIWKQQSQSNSQLHDREILPLRLAASLVVNSR